MYQQIKTFLAIVENKSISDAARALHYTQSTVSTYLNLLENRLGMTLVNRTRGKREVTITADGEAFIPLAQRFVDLEASLDQFIQSRQRRFLRFAASVCQPQTDIFIPLSLTVSSDGQLRIEKGSVLDEEIPGGESSE